MDRVNRLKTPSKKTTVKKITTKTISQSPHKHSEDCIYTYVQDEWELSPKTDYTYAYTLYHRPNQSQSSSGFSRPNMARRSLHASFDNVVHSTPCMSQTSTTASTEISEYDEIEEDHMENQRNQRVSGNDYLPPSVTRSGCMYEPGYYITGSGRRKRRFHASKSHQAPLHTIDHLYGLDEEEEKETVVEKPVEVSIWTRIVQTITSTWTTTSSTTVNNRNSSHVINNSWSDNYFVQILESPFRFIHSAISKIIQFFFWFGTIIGSTLFGSHSTSMPPHERSLWSKVVSSPIQFLRILFLGLVTICSKFTEVCLALVSLFWKSVIGVINSIFKILSWFYSNTIGLMFTTETNSLHRNEIIMETQTRRKSSRLSKKSAHEMYNNSVKEASRQSLWSRCVNGLHSASQIVGYSLWALVTHPILTTLQFLAWVASNLWSVNECGEPEGLIGRVTTFCLQKISVPFMLITCVRKSTSQNNERNLNESEFAAEYNEVSCWSRFVDGLQAFTRMVLFYFLALPVLPFFLVDKSIKWVKNCFQTVDDEGQHNGLLLTSVSWIWAILTSPFLFVKHCMSPVEQVELIEKTSTKRTTRSMKWNNVEVGVEEHGLWTRFVHGLHVFTKKIAYYFWNLLTYPLLGVLWFVIWLSRKLWSVDEFGQHQGILVTIASWTKYTVTSPFIFFKYHTYDRFISYDTVDNTTMSQDDSLLINSGNGGSNVLQIMLLWIFKILAFPFVLLWFLATTGLSNLTQSRFGTSHEIQRSDVGIITRVYNSLASFMLFLTHFILLVVTLPFMTFYHGFNWTRDMIYDSLHSVRNIFGSIGGSLLSVLVSVADLLYLVVTEPLIYLYQTIGWLRSGMIKMACTVTSSTWSTITAVAGYLSTLLFDGWSHNLHSVISKSISYDVWLLSRTSKERRRRGLCCLLPLFLLIPLLLTGLYIARYHRMFGFPVLTSYKADHVQPHVGIIGGCCDRDIKLEARQVFNLMMAEQEKKQSDSVNAAVLSLITAHLDEQKAAQEASIAQLSAEQESRWQQNQDNQQILLKSYVNNLVSEHLSKYQAHQADNGDINAATLNAHSRELENRILALLNDKLNQQKSETNDAISLAIDPHGQAYKDQAALILGLQDQLAAVAAKAEELSGQLNAAKAELKEETQSQSAVGAAGLAAMEKQLLNLQNEITELKTANNMLDTKTANCCHTGAMIARMVQAGVKEEIDILAAAGVLGGTDDNSGGGGIAAGSGCECTGATGIAGGLFAGGLSEEDVRKLIREALIIYGADKTGRVDFALESAGGSIISTRCSQTYHRRTAEFSLFGIPLWYSSNSPRTVIQPEVLPGQCWAFKGTTGFLVIQLAGVVRPDSFSLEHIPKSLSPTGKIDSAPKHFAVYGLKHEKDVDGTLLGNYTYIEDGDSIQHFIVEEQQQDAYPAVELQILSNHGNPEYTCLYRFRVHGKLKKW